MNNTATKLTFVEAPTLQLLNVPIDLINDVPAPVAKARQLSLIELGQIEPIRLRPATNGRYDIVDGRRRVAEMVANGEKNIKALVEFLDDTQSALHALALNISRSHSPMVEARLLASLLEHGHTQQGIAKKLGVTQGLISQRLGLLDLIPELQSRLVLGTMTMSAARAARKLPTADQQRLALLDKITVKAAQEMLRGYQAEMVDLSAINIPEIPAEPTTVLLTTAQFEALAQGKPVEIKINHQVALLHCNNAGRKE